MLVVGYGVAHRLFEFTWKGQLRLLYPSVLEYQGILSSVSQVTGVASIAMIGIASVVFRRFGWGTAAAITPIGMVVAGGVFFGLSMAGMHPGTSGLATAAVMMGAVAQARKDALGAGASHLDVLVHKRGGHSSACPASHASSE